MGSHPLSQIGRDAASSAPSALASSSTMGILSFSLMPRPTETMMSADVRSTARADSRKGSCGFARIMLRAQFGGELHDLCGAVFHLIRPKRAGLNRREMRFGAAEFHVRVQLALKKLANENGRALDHAEADAIADQDLVEASGEFRSEVAHLIGVREQHDAME